MADNSTGLPVKSISGEYLNLKLFDSGGTNVAAVSAAGRLSVDASGVAVPITDNAGSLTVDAPVATPVYVRLSDGAANLIGQKTMAASLPVTLASDQSALAVTVSGGATAANQTNVQVVDNAGFTDGTTTLLMGGFIFDEVAGTALTENDAAAARVNANRAVVSAIEDGSTRARYATVTASNALKVDGSAVTQPVSIAATVGTNLAQVGGTTVVTGGVNGTLGVGGVLAHDAAASSALPVGIGFFASAAAPTAVSTDGDAVKAWALLNGSQVVNLASGGTLITVGQTTMSASLPVVIASNQTAVPANITQVGGATQSASNPLFARLTDGTTALANLGQAAATAWFSKITDGTTTAGVIVGTTALKIDVASIAGTAPGATVPLPVRLTDGSSFYSAGSTAPVLPVYSTQTSSALGAGANTTLTHYVTSGKTGQLAGTDVTSTVPIKIEVGTIVTGTFTTRVVGFALAGQVWSWRSPAKQWITRASADATSGFGVKITNKDATTAADVYSTAFWDEV